MSKNLTEKGSQLKPASSLWSKHLTLLSAVLIMLCTTNSFANRPSMDDNESEAESSDAAPSAVEMMMQQESQQTGDVLNMPAVEIQPGETIKIKLLDTPRRGASMDKVRQFLGEPLRTSDGVGDPPISSWVYPDRIVYFEYSTVLHVVAR